MKSFQNMLPKPLLYMCTKYDPDNVFKKINLIEFPISFVGLSTTKILDVEKDLSVSIYLKTMYKNELLEFHKAHEVSPIHRSFELSEIDNHTISLTFIPKSESIAKLKQNRSYGNRFVFDLRIIQVDGARCCNDEIHSEIGRFYISGEYEICSITHFPEVVDFGNVAVHEKVSKYLIIRNKSQLSANLKYIHVTGFDVTPDEFSIPANSSKKICITIKPYSLLIKKQLIFSIRNPHDISAKLNISDNNFLTYIIDLQVNVIYSKNRENLSIESLHKICEPHIKYTYLSEEIITNNRRKFIASTHLRVTKSKQTRNVNKKSLFPGTIELDNEYLLTNRKDMTQGFCKNTRKQISTLELFDIYFLPFTINFGKVGIKTFAQRIVTVKNCSIYDVLILFLDDPHILYTNKKLKNITLNLKSLSETEITIICQGITEGNYASTFDYIIDSKYHRKYQYQLYVEHPTLMLSEKTLKFGMLTNEHFITSVPVKLFNTFNVDIKFKWEDITHETPFNILPLDGTIRKHSCNICDILYVCKNTKTKTHEVSLIANCNKQEAIPLELNIITKKLGIKFLQPAVNFKEIPLNVETVTRVKLENSSREIALFHVVEPLILGFTINPMSGILRPKMVIAFNISVKISCILEFAFDVVIKINNRENVILPVSGSVTEPKLLIQPKHIYLTRIPCNMITYVPVTIHNISTLKAFVEVIDTGNDNIFNVYIDQGNKKIKLDKFQLDSSESKTVFIKIFDTFRREYDMYIPFKINGLLGPPGPHSTSIDLLNYTSRYMISYENNPKVKLLNMNKDIPYCRVVGVITVPWIQISVEKYEIDFKPDSNNDIEFSIGNVSKYYLFVTIIITSLTPNFTLTMCTAEIHSIVTESNIKFELDLHQEIKFILKFHPKETGEIVTTALLYLDKNLSTPYYNLTFVGKNHTPVLSANTHRIIFPPCIVGHQMFRILKLQYEDKSNEKSFSYTMEEIPGLFVQFTEFKHLQHGGNYRTVVEVELKVCCQEVYSSNSILTFHHESGSYCDVDVSFCSTYCPLTLHTSTVISYIANPYPFYPRPDQLELFNYMEKSTNFIEKWLYYQGFRRDLYPIIPDTFHLLSTAITSPPSTTKSKGINVSYLNFIKRISGPLMKHIRKLKTTVIEDTFNCVKELHDIYNEIIHLLKSRGADIWFLKARFLLSYEQFTTYTKIVTSKCHADIILNKELLEDITLFNNFSKQSWLDFILQSYKVFILDSCINERLSSQPKDIIKILTDWFNAQISQNYNKECNNKPVKIIRNITSDLSDGVAVMSAILNHCPFLQEHFSFFHEVNKSESCSGSIINNACLIIQALNLLKVYFPLRSEDFLEPNFIQMLFFSIHLYVTLPMLKPRDILKFKPPLLRGSSRLITISTANQESVIFNYMILNNSKSSFSVERTPSRDNGKNYILNVKYVANFTDMETCILLIYGYNKTRIYDTYVIFILEGFVGSLSPVKKCKVIGPLYRASKVDVLVSSPFQASATYKLLVTDRDPTIPVIFGYDYIPKFYCRRINLIDKTITLSGIPKDNGQEIQEQKLLIQLICLSTQVGNTWIWFRSDIGEFFIKVTSQPRWDIPIDILQAKFEQWPIVPCCCGEDCECYRTSVIEVPHRNELMLISLRHALSEHASDAMLKVYDKLIETTVGKIIVGMLLLENGTNMSEIEHILHSEMSYRITSRSLSLDIDHVKLAQHTEAMLALPITILSEDKSGKYSITFTSNCGMDIRTYKIVFVDEDCDVV
ncbi:hypothetical protein ACJJTC_009843 [Scirpophaga incertulas]